MAETIQKIRLKIGTKVKILDCSEFEDYRAHKNQTGLICGFYPESDRSAQIKWKDETISAVQLNNMLIINEDWDE